MAEEKQRKIANIVLRREGPTELTFKELFAWVIWQFPRPKKAGLCGAVRPPIPDHGWFPAVIKPKEKRVLVHAHIEEPFPSPEAAVEYFDHPSDQKEE